MAMRTKTHMRGFTVIGKLGLLFICLAAAAGLGCSAAPAQPGSNPATITARTDERVGTSSGNNLPTDTVGNTGVTPGIGTAPPAADAPLENGELPAQPPTNLPQIRIAQDGIEGHYLPTMNYLDPLPFGLIIFTQRDQLCWMLVRRSTSEEYEIMGFGAFREVDGGIELAELKQLDGTPIAIEQFRANRSRNRITVGNANSVGGAGQTCFGKIMAQLGPEVHWVRISAPDEKMNQLFTAEITGSFCPLTRVVNGGAVPRRALDRSRCLQIWPDGEWRLIEAVPQANGATENRVYGGNWSLKSRGEIIFAQTIPPRPDRVNNPPTATYAFAYDVEGQALWLTLISGDPASRVVIAPEQVGAEATVVYQIYRR